MARLADYLISFKVLVMSEFFSSQTCLCIVCNHSFDDLSSLADHKKLVPETPHKCYFCDETFTIVITCKEHKITEITYCYNLCHLAVLTAVSSGFEQDHVLLSLLVYCDKTVRVSKPAGMFCRLQVEI